MSATDAQPALKSPAQVLGVSGLPSAVDVVIIGAGPAGLTLASLLRRHRPSTRVVVLERQRFPRHKIGESLVVDINRVLADMGALDAVESAGFVNKYGATFIWGDRRSPVKFLWSEGEELVRAPEGYHLHHTWHVDRPRYDQILADNARGLGAAMHEGCKVHEVIFEGETAIGVRIVDDTGQEASLRARWVIDCAGGHGPLTQALGGKRIDDALRNIAVFGYLRGMRKTEALTGLPGSERTLILTHPYGWFWVIPISPEVTSVGFITRLDTYRAVGGSDAQAFYEARLRELPEFETLFAEATLCDHRDEGKLVHTVAEYSYTCTRLHGPGWALCGDAGGFVDAILSVGCFLGQTHAQFLAYALCSVLDDDCDEDLALSSYATVVGENLSAFRHVAYLFYAFNPSVHMWWSQCAAELRASTVVPDGDDRDAFVAFFTGFSARSALYEDAVSAFGGRFLLDVGEQLFGDAGRFAGRSIREGVDSARKFVRRNPVLRLRDDVSSRPFALPRTGSGRLAPVARLDLGEPGARVGGLPTAKRLYLPQALADLPERMDGRLSLRELAQDLAARTLGLSADAAFREVCKVGYRLHCMGAVEEAEAVDQTCAPQA